MDEKVINIYKPVGFSPLDVIKKLKSEREEFADKKMSYAGRLDPLARGVLLLLIGKATRNQQDYQNLDKEYVAEVLFGVSTDSLDLLGLVENLEDSSNLSRQRIADFVGSLEGKHKLKVPAFSSPNIEGKPLFWWARERRLDEIEIPKREMVVFESVFNKYFKKSSEEVLQDSISKIKKVKGDFRQEKITKRWKEKLGNKNLTFSLVRFKVQCSSGTYIRSLAKSLGSFLDTPSCLFSLTRTKVGLDKESFWLGDSWRVFK